MEYVLSKNFYDGNLEEMTLLEQEVAKYIKGEALNPDILMDLYKEHVSWNTAEKYYYLPILIMLLKEYIRSMRTEI